LGPLLACRKTSTESLKRNFAVPLIVSLVGGAIFFALGLREFYSLICIILCVFVASTIVMEFFRGARVVRARSGLSWVSSAVDLTLRNTRRYGGYIVHMGMVLIFVGLAGAAFNKDIQKEMKLGSTLQIGRYELLLQNIDSRPEKNYTAERMIIEVFENGKPKMMLYPERRFFPTNEESGTMVAIYSTLRDDLYVVYAGQSPETQTPVIHAYLNPLVKWVWLGGAIVVMGTFVALLPNRRTVLALAGSTEPSPVTELGTVLAPSRRAMLKEGHD
jgi:cytochrome c-type biogenesis protein CcmF